MVIDIPIAGLAINFRHRGSRTYRESAHISQPRATSSPRISSRHGLSSFGEWADGRAPSAIQ